MMRWILLLVLSGGLSLIAACEEETTEPTGAPTIEVEAAETAAAESAYSEDDPEYKLASMDAGEPLLLDDPSIDEYAQLLNRLDAKCGEPRAQIGNYVVTATQLLRDVGIEVTILEALRGINGIIPEGSSPMGCDKIVDAWITYMKSQ